MMGDRMCMLYIDMFNINMMYSNVAERNSALGT